MSIVDVSTHPHRSDRLPADAQRGRHRPSGALGRREAPAGTHVVAAEGVVLPRFLRRDINAALNAAEFETAQANEDTLVGGIYRAGSNPVQAPFIIDGDQATYWEPDRPTH